MPPSLSQKALFGSIHQYIAAFIAIFFSGLTSVFIIRNLTVDDYGVYNFLINIIAMAQVVTALGLVPTLQRYIPEFKERGNNYLLKRIVSASMFIRLAAALIFIFIILIANNWIIEIFNLPLTSNIYFYLLAMIILLVLESRLLGDTALVVLFENRYWNIAQSAYAFLKFVLFYLAIIMGYGITGIIASWLIAEAMLFMLFIIKGYKVIFSLPYRQEDIQPMPLKRLATFGGRLILSQTSFFLRDKAADIFLLAYFLGTYEVGLYSFAYGIPLLLMSFSPGSKLRAIFTSVLTRNFTRTKDKQQLSYFFEFINKIIFFSMIPLFVILMVIADKVILYAFNPAYLTVGNLFILSLGFVMIQQFAHAYSSILYTLEESKIMMIGSIFALYNLIMDFILIPRLEVLGAILATGSAGILLVPYYYFAIKSKEIIQLNYPWKSFARFSVNIAISAIIVYLLKGYISGIPSLFLILAFSGIIYLGISYLNKGFSEKDRRILNEAIGRDIFVF